LDTAEKVIEAMARALATARADGRREGLEMAAKLADQWSEARLDEANAPIISGDVFTDGGVFVQSTADANAGYRLMDLATAIRAMMEKEGTRNDG
jgi:predicted phage gp36 major capsid-like protein